MKKPAIRFGGEVYTWFMKENGRAHANQLDHMIEIVAQAGFHGIEPIHGWMGELADPVRLAERLTKQRVELAAIALALDWNLPEEDATTVAGLVISQSGTIPDVGQRFAFFGYTFEILRRQRNQITALRVVPPEKARMANSE